MRTVLFFLTVVALLVALPVDLPLLAQAKAPVWKENLGEKIIDYHFLQDGKYLFFINGKWMWLYDAKTGQNIYKHEVDDFEGDGIHNLVDNNKKYLVSSGNKLLCYDPLTAKIIWQQEYKDISQDDFTDFDYAGNNAVMRYGNKHIGFNLETGNEVWRNEIEYNGDLMLKGSANWFEVYDYDRFIVCAPGDNVRFYKLSDGQMFHEEKDIEPNGDIVDAGNNWYYRTDDDKFLLMVVNDGALLLDIPNNKIVARHKFGVGGDKPVLVPTTVGCAILGKEKIVHFNFATMQVTEVAFPLDDVRTLHTYNVAGKDLMVFGGDSKMAAVDLVAGKLLWQSVKDDKNFEGYAHHYEESLDGKTLVYGNNIVFTYNNPNISGDEKGTNLYLMSVDALSGKVNYRVKVGLGAFVMTSFTRGLAKVMTSLSTGFMAVASAGMAANPAMAAQARVNDMLGWNNIGFDYELVPFNGNILVVLNTTAHMQNPDTKDDGGEGFVLVDPNSGKIIYKDYFELSDDGQGGLEPPPVRGDFVIEKNIAYMTGKNRVVAFDLSAGKRLWTLEKEMKKDFPVDLAYIDGTLFCKFGKIEYSTALEKDDIKVTEGWKKDPYGFCAIDPSSGKILWRVETKKDPGFSTPYFSIERYYNPNTKQLYFADEENVYGLKLSKDGGKYDWTYNLEKNKVGKIKQDESYAINKTWLGMDRKVTQTDYYFGGSFAYSVKTDIGGVSQKGVAEFMDDAMNAELSSTYESWGNHWGVSANHCLRVLFNGSRILAIGPDGVGYIDPVTGKGEWVHDWNYDKGEVRLLPQVIGSKFLYCIKQKLTLVDLQNGSKVWQAEEASHPGFFFAPDESGLYSIDDEDISGYNLK